MKKIIVVIGGRTIANRLIQIALEHEVDMIAIDYSSIEARVLAHNELDHGTWIDEFCEIEPRIFDELKCEAKHIKIYPVEKDLVKAILKPEPYRGPVRHHKKGRSNKYGER